MPKTPTKYRDILARLDKAFPGKEMLTKAEAAEWMGVSINTVARRYDWPRGYLSKAELARAMSEYTAPSKGAAS